MDERQSFVSSATMSTTDVLLNIKQQLCDCDCAETKVWSKFNRSDDTSMLEKKNDEVDLNMLLVTNIERCLHQLKDILMKQKIAYTTLRRHPEKQLVCQQTESGYSSGTVSGIFPEITNARQKQESGYSSGAASNIFPDKIQSVQETQDPESKPVLFSPDSTLLPSDRIYNRETIEPAENSMDSDVSSCREFNYAHNKETGDIGEAAACDDDTFLRTVGENTQRKRNRPEITTNSNAEQQKEIAIPVESTETMAESQAAAEEDNGYDLNAAAFHSKVNITESTTLLHFDNPDNQSEI